MRYKPQHEQLRAFLNQEIDSQKRIDEILKMKKHFLELGDNGSEFDNLIKVYDLEIEDARFKLSLGLNTTQPKVVEITEKLKSKSSFNPTFQDLGVYEFFVSLSYDEHFNISDSEMYLYLQSKTGNFEKTPFGLFWNEFNSLHCTTEIENPDTGELTTLGEFFVNTVAWKITEERAETVGVNSVIEEIQKEIQIFNNLPFTLKLFKIERNGWKLNIIRRNQLIRFSDILEAEYLKLFDKQKDTQPEANEQTKTPPPRKEKTPLTFSGLFKPDFVLGTKQDELKAILTREGYIKDGVWRELTNGKKNEPAKIYFYLKDKGAIKGNNDLTNDLKTFYAEFGLRAYTDKEERENDSDVTVKNISNPTISKDEKTLFEKVFLSFLTTK